MSTAKCCTGNCNQGRVCPLRMKAAPQKHEEAKRLVAEIRNEAIEEVALWYQQTGYLLEFEDMQDAMRALKSGC